jgi:hypothetical protein
LYEEFLALWDKQEDVKRTQTLENMKSRRLLGHATSAFIREPAYPICTI